MNEIIIDENTFIQTTNQDTEDYIKFLEENPSFVDFNKKIEENRRKREENIKKIEDEKKQLELEKQRRLEEAHKKAEDFNFMPYCYWLEVYLPYYMMEYGEFSYSSKDLSNRQKIDELLKYYGEVCGITKIEDIFKKRPHRGRSR